MSLTSMSAATKASRAVSTSETIRYSLADPGAAGVQPTPLPRRPTRSFFIIQKLADPFGRRVERGGSNSLVGMAWADTPFARRLGVRFPVIQAPMAAGLSTPALA